MLLTLSVAAREWKTTSGRTLDAELVRYNNGVVLLKQPDGGSLMMSIGDFIPEDQSFIREQFPHGDPEPRIERRTAPQPQPRQQTQKPPTQRQRPPQTDRQRRPDYRDHPGLEFKEVGETPEEMTFYKDGTEIPLSSFRGKVTAIAFWSPGVQASLREMQKLNALNNTFRKTNAFAAVSVAMTNRRKDVDGFYESARIDMPVLLDGQRNHIRKFGVKVLPTIVVLDESGVILYEHLYADDIYQFLTHRIENRK